MAIHFYPNVIFASKALGQCYKHFLDRSSVMAFCSVQVSMQRAGFLATCRLPYSMQATLQRAGFHSVCRFPCSMQVSMQHAGFHAASMQVSMQRACRDNHMQVSMQCAGFLATCRLPYSMQASLQRACRDISVAGFHAMQVSTQ